MTSFSVNPHRRDPYKNFKFKITFDGKIVAGISKVSSLTRRTEVIEYREGGDSSLVHKTPGRTSFEPIILERGVTHDVEFENWANKTWTLQNSLGSEVSLKDFRKDIIIDLFNEAGQLVLRYLVYGCWVSEYEALPELNANTFGIAIQKITLENEGWERDKAVIEPSEPKI